jgi:hypothetical protein
MKYTTRRLNDLDRPWWAPPTAVGSSGASRPRAEAATRGSAAGGSSATPGRGMPRALWALLWGTAGRGHAGRAQRCVTSPSGSTTRPAWVRRLGGRGGRRGGARVLPASTYVAYIAIDLAIYTSLPRHGYQFHGRSRSDDWNQKSTPKFLRKWPKFSGGNEFTDSPILLCVL